MSDRAQQRREMYDDFLKNVPLLSSIDAYERSTLADALEPHEYQAGETIIREGDEGSNFYLITEGEAVASKLVDGYHTEVYQYG